MFHLQKITETRPPQKDSSQPTDMIQGGKLPTVSSNQPRWPTTEPDFPGLTKRWDIPPSVDAENFHKEKVEWKNKNICRMKIISMALPWCYCQSKIKLWIWTQCMIVYAYWSPVTPVTSAWDHGIPKGFYLCIGVSEWACWDWNNTIKSDEKLQIFLGTSDRWSPDIPEGTAPTWVEFRGIWRMWATLKVSLLAGFSLRVAMICKRKHTV